MRIDNLDLTGAHRSKKSWEPNEGREEPQAQGVGGTYELAEAMGSTVKDAARRSSEDEEEEEQMLR